MSGSGRRWLFAIATALYFYFLLPATAVMFYELHHLTGLGFIYWIYGGFKAAGYYLSVWEYRLPACILAGLMAIFIPTVFRTLRGK
ncbi:MAG: hypothetical protein ACI9JM_001861 [Halioglobus sp.]|jgi:hypothetical protein